MNTRKRILVGSVLALATTGIVAGAAVSAFANGPHNEWAGPAAAQSNYTRVEFSHLASEWLGPVVSNATAVEYATSHAAVLTDEWGAPVVSNPTAIEYAKAHAAVLTSEWTGPATEWTGPATEWTGPATPVGSTEETNTTSNFTKVLNS